VALTFLALQRAGLQQALFALTAFFWVVLAPLWIWRGVQPSQTVWTGAAGFAVLVPAGLAMVRLEPLAVLLVLALVWIADSAAYFVGRAWGRRKLAPAISPGKTWEGVAGGLIGAALYAIIIAFFTDPGAWLALVVTALLLGMATAALPIAALVWPIVR
jgi:phosphatidate cytidylyltransferase